MSESNSMEIIISFGLTSWTQLSVERGGAPTSKGFLHPLPNDARYPKWKQEDQTVFMWLIQNIESNLIGNISRYPVAKALWDGLATTYGSSTYSLHAYTLHQWASAVRQGGGTLEACWDKLVGIWMRIDERDPNPMICARDIEVYQRKLQEHKLISVNGRGGQQV